MDLEPLIRRAKQGDLGAFAEVTRRFQHMAFGHALALLHDVLGQEEWTAGRLAALPSVDVVIRLSRELAQIGIYPTIDPLASRSRLLDASLVGQEHGEVAARVREALRAALADKRREPPAMEHLTQRARKIQRFFAQPFYVAEPHTCRPGVSVSRTEALRACPEILDGVHDAISEEAFYFTGGIDEIRTNTRASQPARRR